jgi:hypothetical protein
LIIRIKFCEVRNSFHITFVAYFSGSLCRDVDYLHISAHGSSRKKIDGKLLDKENRHVLEIGRKEECGRIIKRGELITPSEIRRISVKAKNMFVSACFGGHKDFFKAFFKDERKGVYMGPCRAVDGDLAFLVALDFHRGAFIDQNIRRGINLVGKILRSSGKGTYYYFRSPKDLS